MHWCCYWLFPKLIRTKTVVSNGCKRQWPMLTPNSRNMTTYAYSDDGEVPPPSTICWAGHSNLQS
ncbi:hypothetical protein IEQ34_001766 [Dendrobium chrysotoxum]|uniref:Uncharacterized protein n=1 Tax=Dendrobium chrysotoxum TaxID=161865 RepID=A0AAV7HRR7_DENCH|nr:hypothetical protein IEQ34_001766 [Dendrobium chrysotoxum]